MLNHYIINGFVEFHPAESTLRNLNDPEKVVVLNSPAGRCLLLLIKRSDQIVTQHEFMEIVWEQNGMLVTPNTFYQNVSILRKGLKKVGLDEGLVVTIPRVGLTLASGTQIKKRYSETLVETSEEEPPFTGGNAQEKAIHEENGCGQYSGMKPSERSATKPVMTLTAQSSQISSLQHAFQYRFPYACQWVMGITAMILFVVGMSLALTMDNTTGYFHEYPLLGNVGQCHVFIDDKNVLPDEKSRTLSLIENFKKSCGDFPWIYVTHYYMLPRVSIIRCNKKMDDPNTCVSEYYFKGLKNVD